MELALTLFMAWIAAYDADNALAANDAAILTKGLYGWTNSHGVGEGKSADFFEAAGGEPTGVP